MCWVQGLGIRVSPTGRWPKGYMRHACRTVLFRSRSGAPLTATLASAAWAAFWDVAVYDVGIGRVYGVPSNVIRKLC